MSTVDGKPTRVCSHCLLEVRGEAKVCPHCGNIFKKGGREEPENE